MTSTITSPVAQGSPGARFEARMATDRLRCLGYAKALGKTFRPETVHKLRTHLRRLQSYAEYLDRPKAAKRLGEAVSWFSRLRTLDEFQRYLSRLEVGAKDCRRAEKALRNEQEDVRKANCPAAVTLLLTNIPIARLIRPGEYIADRFRRLQPENRNLLDRGLQRLSSKPTRKELHRLRLLIKSLRYQQEIAVQMRWGNPRSVKALKRLQTVLGKYTDRAQFVSLAKELNLRCRDKIKKDRRLSRKKACRAVLKLKSGQAQPLLPIRRYLTSV